MVLQIYVLSCCTKHFSDAFFCRNQKRKPAQWIRHSRVLYLSSIRFYFQHTALSQTIVSRKSMSKHRLILWEWVLGFPSSLAQTLTCLKSIIKSQGIGEPWLVRMTYNGKPCFRQQGKEGEGISNRKRKESGLFSHFVLLMPNYSLMFCLNQIKILPRRHSFCLILLGVFFFLYRHKNDLFPGVKEHIFRIPERYSASYIVTTTKEL